MDRLRQRADFLAVADGVRANSPAFVVQSRARTDQGPTRIGFTVTKKNGTATERNRIRRRLRELVRKLDPLSMQPHSDYVLVGRRDALSRDFSIMLDDLKTALRRLDRPRQPHGKPAQTGQSRARQPNAERLNAEQPGAKQPNAKTAPKSRKPD
jgi:ribonuclease P protein component